MKLYYQTQGAGKPLIIVHGLFGSSDNWRSIASEFSKERQVITVDLANHGQSPHNENVSYQAMADDIAELILDLNLINTDVIGHSIGGKVAMALAANNPQFINKLVIVDIGPKQYPDRHSDIFDALLAIDLPAMNKRSDADNALAKTILNKAIRQFLLMNLIRDEGQMKWRINLSVLAKKYAKLIEGVGRGKVVKHPSLFIRGALSDYILEEDLPMIKQHFPNADFITIERAGHWIHAEKPEEFITHTQRFLAHD